METSLPILTTAGTLEELAEACDRQLACRAFTSSGYLKQCSAMPPLSEWNIWPSALPCEGLFVKEPTAGGPCDPCTEIYCKPAAPSSAARALLQLPTLPTQIPTVPLHVIMTALAKPTEFLTKVAGRLSDKERKYCLLSGVPVARQVNCALSFLLAEIAQATTAK